jgi:hypothetical protein
MGRAFTANRPSKKIVENDAIRSAGRTNRRGCFTFYDVSAYDVSADDLTVGQCFLQSRDDRVKRLRVVNAQLL